MHRLVDDDVSIEELKKRKNIRPTKTVKKACNSVA